MGPVSNAHQMSSWWRRRSFAEERKWHLNTWTIPRVVVENVSWAEGKDFKMRRYCTYFFDDNRYICVWAVTDILYTASLWCASVYSMLTDTTWAYVSTFPMKCMFTPLNRNNKVTIFWIHMLPSCLPQRLVYSLSAVLCFLACRPLWLDHLRLIRFIDGESDTSLYAVHIWSSVKGLHFVTFRTISPRSPILWRHFLTHARLCYTV